MKKVIAASFAVGLAAMISLPASAALRSQDVTSAPHAKPGVAKVQVAGILDCYAYRLNSVYGSHNIFSQIGHAALFGALEGAFTLGLCIGMN